MYEEPTLYADIANNNRSIRVFEPHASTVGVPPQRYLPMPHGRVLNSNPEFEILAYGNRHLLLNPGIVREILSSK